MKICILVRILWSAGTQKFAISEAKALQSMGHEVELVFLRKSAKGNVYDDLLKDVKVFVLSERNESPFVPLYDYITGIFMESRKGEGRVDYNLIRKFPSFAKDRGYDLIICQDQWAGLAGYYNWKKYGTDYLVVIHERVNDFPWVRGWKRLLVNIALNYQRKILLNAKGVFSITGKIARTVEKFYSNYGLKSGNAFPGLENRGFRGYGERENSITLLSYWNKIKVPDQYIPLIREIRNYSFIMVGNWISNEYRAEFLKKLQAEGLLARVELRENVSENEKVDLLSKSKFFIRFGIGEFGMAIGTVEALECGTPVVVNEELGISDYLRDYSNCLIVSDVSKVEEIKKFIESNDNPVSYGKLQEEIRRMIRDFTWQNHCKFLLKSVAEIGVQSTHELTRGAND